MPTPLVVALLECALGPEMTGNLVVATSGEGLELKEPNGFGDLKTAPVDEGGTSAAGAGEIGDATLFLPSRIKAVDGAAESQRLAGTFVALAAKVPDEGVLAALVPDWLLQRADGQSFREALCAAAAPTVIVEGGRRLLRMPEARWDVSEGWALIIGRVGDPPETERFFRIPADPSIPDSELTQDFEKALRQEGGRTRFGLIHRGGLEPAESLSWSYYTPEALRHRAEIGAHGALANLANLAEILETVRVEPGTNAEAARERIPVIQAREVSDDGQFQPLAQRLAAPASGGSALAVGDICVRSVVPRGAQRMAVLDVTESMCPAMAASSLIALRPKPDQPVSRTFLLDYLRSPRAFRLLVEETGTGRLHDSDLAHLPVPIPNSAVELALGELGEARRTLLGWADEIERVEGSLFEESSYEAAVSEILGRGQRISERVTAGSRVDELPYRVRTQFPFPLAQLWRGVEASAFDLEGYVRTLEASEMAALFLACLCIINATTLDIELGALRDLARRMTESGHATTFGDWAEIVREGTGRSFRARLGDETPIPEVVEALAPGTAGEQALFSLKTRRDAQAHGKGPRGASIGDAAREAQAELREVVGSCDFLTQYRLRLIDSTAWDSIAKKNQVEFRDLIGDHHLVPLHLASLPLAEIEPGSLYLVDRHDRHHLLRPLLLWEECDECGVPSAFFLDRYEPKDEACLLRSMEHGHTIERKDLRPVFEQVGLLERRLEAE